MEKVKIFKNTPLYFYTPLHGFANGGLCVGQALEQAPSMRFIMKTFQCDDHYRERCYRHALKDIDIDCGLAIDVGCGSGDSAIALDDNVETEVIGFDLSRAMVKLARKRTGLKIYTADAANLPLGDESVSILTCFAVLHELPREYSQKVLREFARVTKKGGYIMIWDQNPENIGTLQHDMTSIPIEPYLLSYKKLDISRELETLGVSTSETPDRFMKWWVGRR
jgi:ubiquinone/menaquinone biosynthesis C-methylase UbiE